MITARQSVKIDPVLAQYSIVYGYTLGRFLLFVGWWSYTTHPLHFEIVPVKMNSRKYKNKYI